MNCPTCAVLLKMTDRRRVEIDYCPQCRGIWLDRGELDKIIERSAQAAASVRETPEPSRGDEYRQPNYGEKTKSFFGEIFYFG